MATSCPVCRRKYVRIDRHLARRHPQYSPELEEFIRFLEFVISEAPQFGINTALAWVETRVGQMRKAKMTPEQRQAEKHRRILGVLAERSLDPCEHCAGWGCDACGGQGVKNGHPPGEPNHPPEQPCQICSPPPDTTEWWVDVVLANEGYIKDS